MQLIFIRHGHYDKERYRTGSARKTAPLSQAGEEDARRAGMDLDERGIRPDFVLHTSTERTRQTAALVLQELGLADHRMINVGSAFRDLDGFARKLATWTAENGITDDSVVFLVGHGSTQDALRKCFSGGSLPPTARQGHGAWLELFVEAGGVPRGGGFFAGRRKSAQAAGRSRDHAGPVP